MAHRRWADWTKVRQAAIVGALMLGWVFISALVRRQTRAEVDCDSLIAAVHSTGRRQWTPALLWEEQQLERHFVGREPPRILMILRKLRCSASTALVVVLCGSILRLRSLSSIASKTAGYAVARAKASEDSACS